MMTTASGSYFVGLTTVGIFEIAAAGPAAAAAAGAIKMTVAMRS